MYECVSIEVLLTVVVGIPRVRTVVTVGLIGFVRVVTLATGTPGVVKTTVVSTTFVVKTPYVPPTWVASNSSGRSGSAGSIAVAAGTVVYTVVVP